MTSRHPAKLVYSSYTPAIRQAALQSVSGILKTCTNGPCGTASMGCSMNLFIRKYSLCTEYSAILQRKPSFEIAQNTPACASAPNLHHHRAPDLELGDEIAQGHLSPATQKINRCVAACMATLHLPPDDAAAPMLCESDSHPAQTHDFLSKHRNRAEIAL